MSGFAFLLVAEATLLTQTYWVAYTQLRLHKFLDVQQTVLALIQSVELRFHKLHPFLHGDLAALVGIHNEQQLLDLFFSECQFVLQLRSCCLWRDPSP